MFIYKFEVYRPGRQGKIRMSSDCYIETELNNIEEVKRLALDIIWKESAYRNQELMLITKVVI